MEKAHIPPEGLAAIAEALEHNTVLTDIDLSREKDSREAELASRQAVQAIRASLAKNKRVLVGLMGEEWVASIRRPGHMKGIESVYRTA